MSVTPTLQPQAPPHVVEPGRTRNALNRCLLASVKELAAAESAWRELADAQTSPMESFGWSLAAASSVADEQSPRVLTLHSDRHARGFAPLAVVAGSLTGRMELLGLRRLNEPADFLAGDADARRELVRWALKLRRPLTLHRVFADSPTVLHFERLGPRFGWTVVRPQAPCPQILLDDSWRQPESHLNAGRRSDFRRAWRRAEKLGPVRAEILSPTPEQLPPLLETAFEIEAKSWKGAAGTALACDKVRGSFIRGYCQWAAEHQILRLCLLSIGELPVAMQIAVETCEGLWLLKIGFDPQFAQCSPGILLLADSIRYAAERGLKTFEFLGTAEKWTRVWTERERPCVAIRHYPYSWRGVGELAVDASQAIRAKVFAKVSAGISPPHDEKE